MREGTEKEEDAVVFCMIVIYGCSSDRIKRASQTQTHSEVATQA